MCIFYLIALIPVLIGAYFWLKLKEMTFVEWMICCLVSFLTAFIFHLFTTLNMQTDYQIVSGNVVKVIYYPKWVEKYEVPIYRTQCTGYGKSHSCRSVFSHYESRFRTHNEYWEGHSNLPSSKEIKKDKFQDIKNQFKNLITEKTYKSGFWSGDPNIYVSYNKNNLIVPINETSRWDNPIKGKKSLFNFPDIPDKEKKNLYLYPESKDWFVSSRLLGKAKQKIQISHWDALNTELGNTKKVNLIMIGFDSKLPQNICMYQEALWFGGKKNDVVLCYREQANKVISSYVFGWTESDLLKRNLETLLLENNINNQIIDRIKSQVESYYVLKDFTKYKYITSNVSGWVICSYILVMVVLQFITFDICINNSFYQKSKNQITRYDLKF